MHIEYGLHFKRDLSVSYKVSPLRRKSFCLNPFLVLLSIMEPGKEAGATGNSLEWMESPPFRQVLDSFPPLSTFHGDKLT